MVKWICNYFSIGDCIMQGGEMGFIKFGLRVDFFLLFDVEVKVNIGVKVKGNKIVIVRI